VFYLAPGTDGSLAFYTEAVFMRLAEQLDHPAPNCQDLRAFSRLFYAQAQRVEIDRQGRMRIPVALSQLAGLEREIILIGVRDHVEIWNRAHWEQYLTQQQTRYDEIADAAFGHSTSGTVENVPSLEDRPVQPR